MIIAIDGPAASGKGTLAKRVAAHFRLPHLDTGLLYRAVARHILDEGLDLSDSGAAERVAFALEPSWLEDPRLRSAEAGEAASRIATFPAVRSALLAYQRAFAHQPGGAILDGRDIGTVIAPDADVKIWVTARPAVRAARRTAELVQRGHVADEQAILADLLARDQRDGPNMRRSPSAYELDTSDMGVDQMLAAALGVIQSRLPQY
jgi:cytidylate kinase